MLGVREYSAAVDVWSVGVILFQLLYGRKPFGDNMSQQDVARQHIVSYSSLVQFPEDGPKVSDAARAFVARCLTPQPDLRPLVAELLNDPFISTGGFKKPKKKKSGSA